MDSLSVYFLVWIIMGLVCARVARSRGRSMAVWFVLGVLFSFVALLALWILPSKVTQDTSNQPADAPKVAPVAIAESKSPDMQTLPIEEASAEASSSAASSTYWHYIDEKKQTLGPVSFSSLQEKWHAGEISTSTYVWNESMDAWKKIADLPEIAPFFGKDSIN